MQNLHPILIDGVQFLFVDDISHVLGLHQDKTLFVIAMYASIKGTQNPISMEDICIDFNFEDVTKSLALPKQHELMELLVAYTIVQILKCKEFYEIVPKSSIASHKPLTISNAKGSGSIKISTTNLVEHDDAIKVGSELNAFKDNWKTL